MIEISLTQLSVRFVAMSVVCIAGAALVELWVRDQAMSADIMWFEDKFSGDVCRSV